MIPGIKKRGVNLGDLLMYVAVALKHLRLMVLLICLSLAVGLFYYVYARPLYYVKSIVRYTTLERPIDTDKMFRDSSERTIREQLISDHIQCRAAKQLGIAEYNNTKVLYGNYIRKVMVRFNSEKNLEIEVTGYSLDIVRRWGEALVMQFTQDRDERRMEQRDKIINAFTNDMHELTQIMDNALKSKFAFTDEKQRTEMLIKLNQLRELPTEIAAISERMAALERTKGKLVDNSLDISARLSLLATLESQAKLMTGDTGLQGSTGTGAKAATVVVIPDFSSMPKGWETLDKERSQLKSELAEVEKKYGAAHPKMQEIQKKMAAINKKLDAELESAQKRIALEYQNLTERKKDLLAKLPEYNATIKDNAKYEQELAITTAGKTSFGTIYEQMAQKVQMLDFAGDKERVYLHYLYNASTSDNIPISPNRMKIALGALAFGILLAMGIPFLIEFLDHTVSNVEDAEHNYKVRGLGIVPRLEPGQFSGYPMISSHGASDRHLVENFRVIRTNILSNGAVSKNPQVIVVASAMPEEGKTVVSVNLALSFAQMGEKTILLDADLRRGRIHRVFDFRSSPGLSNVLMDKIPWEEACRATENENLTLLPCGKHLEGATEMVGTPVFEKLLEELRGKFQRIIIDTPPVLGLSETAMMQKLIDGVVFVIWSGRTPSRYVKSALDVLHANRANIYGFVLNRLDLTGVSNYYNYYNYYYYSYNYYYSYKDRPKAVEKV